MLIVFVVASHFSLTHRATCPFSDHTMKVFVEIAKTNRLRMSGADLPFYVGFGACFAAGIVSIPLVFHLPTVLDWFITRRT